MPATRRLVLDLPEDTVRDVEARVAAGEFASASDLVAAQLDAPPSGFPRGWEAWLAEGDGVISRRRAGLEPGSPAQEVFARVRAGLVERARSEGRS